MEQRWWRIEPRLAEPGCADARAWRPGADPQAIAQLERHLGVALPDPVRRFLAIHDGQDGSWLDAAAMNAGRAGSTEPEPAGTIEPMYRTPDSIALTDDDRGNHVGLDVDPDTSGRPGQAIAFGRDDDSKRHRLDGFARPARARAKAGR